MATMESVASDLPVGTDIVAITNRREKWTRIGLLAPAIAVITVFGIMPLLIILVYSFLEPGTYGGVVWNFSPAAYVQFLFELDIFDETLSFSTSYLEIYWRSFLLAVFSTLGCLLIGFPTAYFIATRPPAQRSVWLFLITLPFWSNLLVRTFAVLLILRDEGLINDGLIMLDIVETPVNLLYTDFAIGVGLLYSFLPFMVLPLYASLEKIDFRMVEAGFDLYANRMKVLSRIIVPLAKPGLIAGSILVFIPGLGAFITPVILGGGKNLMIGNLIGLQFAASRNWPFGCAAALILMAMVMILLMVYVRNTKKLGGDHG